MELSDSTFRYGEKATKFEKTSVFFKVYPLTSNCLCLFIKPNLYEITSKPQKTMMQYIALKTLDV